MQRHCVCPFAGPGGKPHGPMALRARWSQFTVHAETLGEAVAQHPPRALVFKGGRLVARDGAFLG